MKMPRKNRSLIYQVMAAFVLIAIGAGFGYGVRQLFDDGVKEGAVQVTGDVDVKQKDSDLEEILNASTTVRTLEIGKSKFFLIERSIAKSVHPKQYEIWLKNKDIGSNRLVKSVGVQECEKVDFRREGDHVVFSLDRECGSAQYEDFRYYLYNSDGDESFVYEHSAWDSAAKAGLFVDNRFTVELNTTSCEQKGDAFETEINGIRIDAANYPLKAAKAECTPAELGPAIFGPSFTFADFDWEYGVLTLNLPDGKPIMIDMRSRRVVLSKRLYSEPCVGGRNDLTLTTPSGTTVLAENVWDDPVFKESKHKNLTCLTKTLESDEVNPTFNLELNYGEGVDYFGTYRFNTESRRFGKIK